MGQLAQRGLGQVTRRPDLPVKETKDMAKIDPDAKLRTMLEAVIEEYAQNAGTDFQSAFRDALTDLKHIADEKGIDFDETVIVALEVAAQETEKHTSSASTS